VAARSAGPAEQQRRQHEPHDTAERRADDPAVQAAPNRLLLPTGEH
jgi:hypothetical protein